MLNEKMTKKTSCKEEEKRQKDISVELERKCGVMYPVEWMYYSNPYDFD